MFYDCLIYSLKQGFDKKAFRHWKYSRLVWDFFFMCRPIPNISSKEDSMFVVIIFWYSLEFYIPLLIPTHKTLCFGRFVVFNFPHKRNFRWKLCHYRLSFNSTWALVTTRSCTSIHQFIPINWIRRVSSGIRRRLENCEWVIKTRLFCVAITLSHEFQFQPTPIPPSLTTLNARCRRWKPNGKKLSYGRELFEIHCVTANLL